jgi:hypothetical protein
VERSKYWGLLQSILRIGN